MANTKVLKERPVGKRIGGYLYIHQSAKSALSNYDAAAVSQAALYLPKNFKWSVLKIEQRDRQQVSFLDYEDFNLSAFPALFCSCSVDLKTGHAGIRKYSQQNPPILHRKELLLSFRDPRRAVFAAETKLIEELGLFKEMYRMGRRKQWTNALAQGGLDAEGIPIGRSNFISTQNSKPLSKTSRERL